ncbi:hypothetical protein PVK06_004877 [Gossypium arboreum]|uniref:Uncharacterized protein n=1 Tax=Gossypium arboreum TaxID=29729 RepID=A0ABR0QTC2_GOSAR|nr:hypothetical protein PVK06_004877 [Gossypium arboreum]
MSHKKTRSSMTTPENLILIDEEVKERFDSIFKHQPMMPEKGFNLKNATKVIVQKKKVPLTSKSINDLFNLPDVEEDEYYSMMDNINWDFLQQVLDVVTNSGFQWIIRKLVERVHELNQGKQEEPTEPDTEESTNETETEANSITNTEEEESVKELNSPKPIEGSKNPEPRVEPEEEPAKLSVELESATLMPNFPSALKKLELSI